LHILKNLKKHNKKDVIVSVGTDGIDGNTDAAGAISDSDISTQEMSKFLRNNDSYHFFKKYGGLIFTGPTHTNLMDIGLILRR
jgi:glycerate 2-kinase